MEGIGVGRLEQEGQGTAVSCPPFVIRNEEVLICR